MADLRDDFIAQYEAEQNRQNAARAAAIIASQGGKGVEVAQDRKLAGELEAVTGMKVPLSMMPSMRQQARRQIDYAYSSTVLSQRPTLAQFMQNPEVAAIAKDDLSKLAGFSDSVDGLIKAGQAGAYGMGAAVNTIGMQDALQSYYDQNRSWWELAQNEAGTLSVDGKPVLGPDGKPAQVFPGPLDMLKAATRYLDANIRTGDEALANAREAAASAADYRQKLADLGPTSAVTEDMQKRIAEEVNGPLSAGLFIAKELIDPRQWDNLIQYGVETAISSNVLPGMAVSVATKNPTAGLAIMGLTNFAQEQSTTVEQLLKERGIDISDPAAIDQLAANPQVIAEVQGLADTRAAVVAGIDVLSAMVTGQSMAKNPFSEAVAQLFVGGTLGGAGEALGNVAIDREVDWGNVAMEFLAEFVGTPFEMVTAGREFEMQKRRAEATKAQHETFTKAVDELMGTNLKQSAPDLARDLVDRLTAGKPVDQRYVNPGQLIDLMQSADEARAVLSELGVTEEQFDDAVEADTEVAIPTSQFFDKVAGSKYHDVLIENSSFGADQMTPAQAEQFMANNEAAISETYSLAMEMAQERKTQEEIYNGLLERFTAEIKQTGQTDNLARLAAVPYAAFYATLQKEAGVSADSVIGGLRFAGPDPTGANNPVQQQNARAATLKPKPVTAASVDVSAPPASGEETIVTPDGGMQFNARFEVIDAGSLVAASGEMQPRDRANRVGSQDQIRDIAAKLDPMRLASSRESDRGSPIIDEGNVVISGNGRTAAIIAAKSQNPDGYTRYVESLKSMGYSVDGMDTPVLVRRASGLTAEQKKALAVASNPRGGGMEMSPAEQAMVDRDLITPDMLADFDTDAEGGVEAAANRKFVQKFLAKLTANERNSMQTSDGDLAPAGVRRIQAALFAAAYGDKRLVERAIEEGADTSITNALIGAAAAWARMRNAVRISGQSEAFDITDKLVEALNLIRRARNKKQSLADYLSQIDAFSEEDPDAVELSKVFMNKSGNRLAAWRDIRDRLTAYANEVSDTAGSQTDDMFGGGAASGMDIIRGGNRKALLQQAADEVGISTDAFAQWFGDSKVVDPDGKPLVVYHGIPSKTDSEFAFDPERKGVTSFIGIPVEVHRQGFYFAEKEGFAKGFADQSRARGGGEVLQVYLSIRNPLDVTSGDNASVARLRAVAERMKEIDPGFNVDYIADKSGYDDFWELLDTSEGGDVLVQAAKDLGYDGIKMIEPDYETNDPDYITDDTGAVTWVAFDPTQIKSVNNRGTFDPNDPRILYQRAYHGTPHLFERFSLDKIGTGEGAQAFGWGLYFAGKKEIAEHYRDMLSKDQLRVADGSTFDPQSLKHRNVKVWADKNRTDVDATISQIEERIAADPNSPVIDMLREDLATMQDIKARGGLMENTGRLFEVDIPEDGELLIWDKPLSEQPEGVKEKLDALMGTLSITVERSELERKNILRINGEWSGYVPDGGLASVDFSRLYTALALSLDGPAEASKALRSAGIPGHRYLDGTSRADGDGSYNFVIYDDSRVSVDAYEQRARGAISYPASGFGSGETVIRIFQSGDLSTFIHEGGHLFLLTLQNLAAQQNPWASGMMGDVQNWMLKHANDVARFARKSRPGAKVTTELVQQALSGQTVTDPALAEAIDVGMQELWAETFERWMASGEAPSVGLKAAFEQFAKWLITIYKNLTGLGVKPDPEISDVFSRLLATEDQIAQARADAGLPSNSVFATAEQMGVTDEQFAVFKRLVDQAGADQRAAILKKVMLPIQQKKTQEYRDARVSIRKEVERRLKADGIYRAIQILRFGQDFDEVDETGKMVKAGEEIAMKLDRTEVEKAYGADVIAKLPGSTKDGKGHKNAVFANEGGVHPDMAANALGFNSGRDLIDAITAAKPLDEAIDDETARLLAERFPDPMMSETFDKEVSAAVHNETQGRVLVAEVKAIADVIDQKLDFDPDQERDIAERALSKVTVRDATNSRAFLAAERRAGRDAERLARAVTRSEMWLDAAKRRVSRLVSGSIKENDTAMAAAVPSAVNRANKNVDATNKMVGYFLDAKRRQLSAFMLHSASIKLEKRLTKTLDRLWKLSRADSKQSRKIDIDYVKAARAIAGRFNMANADSTFDFNAWLQQLEADDPIRKDALTRAIEVYGQNPRDYKKLTVAEIETVIDAIDNLLEQGKRMRSIEIQGKEVSREKATDEIMAALQAMPAKERVQLQRSLVDWEKTRKAILSFRASLVRVEEWARYVDGGKQGAITSYIIRPVMDALDGYRTIREAKLSELVSVLNVIQSNLSSIAIPARELDYTFTNKAELLHAILHTGNQSNYEKLLIGRGWAPRELIKQPALRKDGTPRMSRKTGLPIMDRGRVDDARWKQFLGRMYAEGVITKQDMDAVQKIWDLMEGLKRPAQATHKKLYGFYFKEIENGPVVTPFGTYKGGYVPAIADRHASLDGATRADQQALEGSTIGTMMPTAGSGFTKSRVDNYRTPLALDLKLLPMHMDKVLRFTHLDPVVRQTFGLLNQAEVRQSLEEVSPGILPSAINPWLIRAAKQTKEATATVDGDRALMGFFRVLRQRVGLATMFANVVNTAQNLTAFAPAMILVKPGRIKSAFVRYTMGGASEMRAEIERLSPFMKDRMNDTVRDLDTQLDQLVRSPTVLGGIRDWTTKHGYFLQTALQNQIDLVVWHAAFDQAMANGMSSKDAAFEADSTIRRVMGDFNPENSSQFENGNAIQKVLTMFASYFNTQANLVGGNMAQAFRENGYAGAPRAAMIFMLGVTIPAIMGKAISDGLRGEAGDEDDDGYADDIFSDLLLPQVQYVTGMIPYAGSIINTALSKLTEAMYDDRINVSPVYSALERVALTPYNVGNAVVGDGRASKAVEDTIYSLGLILGVPTGQLAKTMSYPVRVAEGTSSPEGPADIAQGLMFGRDGTE